MRLLPTLSAFVLLSWLPGLATSAQAWPNGPDEDPRDDKPNDPGFGGQWNLWSHFPEAWLPNIQSELERSMGPGIHADRAWQVTTGDRRVIVAVHDSGVYWDNRDLVNKYYLNRGELGNCKPAALAQPPVGADDFDVDGSGWFDIRDYYAGVAENDRLAEWDANGNGMLDPQDLIIKCSDGGDADGNGYIDDISGWDFFMDDNDAYDDTRFGHGNGEARDSTSEGNDGRGDIGVCPNCTTLMVRVGDSFVADSNHFAQGVVFSVDSGASLIQSALGAINYTTFARHAIDYAYANNVALVASAADELSYHHNYPGSGERSIYVHAIQYDESSPSVSKTFLNFNNCTNYGMQLLLSTPGTGCSSEAVGITSGHVGLMYSIALETDLTPPLSAEEVKQILTMESDDIKINPNDSDPEKYPSREGWDWHFGYGRNNARRTVDAIRNRTIPPEVYIETPTWFEVIDPARTPNVDVTCRLNKRADGEPARYDEVDWVLEYATGVAPLDAAFVQIATGKTEGLEGKCATWDVSAVALDLSKKVTDPHQNAVTLRLRATATTGSGVVVRGEHRKGYLFHTDPTSWAAYPKNMDTSLESSPIFADLDGDKKEEIVIFASSGFVHAFKPDGTEAAGFPVGLPRRPAMAATNTTNVANSCGYRDSKAGCRAQNGGVDPDVARMTGMMPGSIGDLDGDGTLEVVVTTWDGYVFVIEHDGTLRTGWPKTMNFDNAKDTDEDRVMEPGFFASPVLYDLDQQPGLEIIAAAMDQHIYVWHADGSVMAPYPVRLFNPNDSQSVETRARIVSTPAVGDIDGDGKPDIASGCSEVYGAAGVENEAVAYVIDGQTGVLKDGWPVSLYGLTVNVLPIVGRGVVANPMLADLDFDGKLEVSFDTISTQGLIFRHDGSEYRKMNNRTFGAKSDSTDSPAYILMNNGAFANIDGEGGIDMVKGTAGFDFAIAFAGGGKRASFDHHMSGWDTDTGLMMEGYPRKHDDWQFFNTPTVVDLTGDGKPEVVIGSGGYLLHAWNYLGNEPANFPKQTGGWIIASAGVGDFDGDGKFDVSVSTRDGWLFAWKTDASVKNNFQWNGFGHNPMKTGNYEDDPTPFAVWTNDPVEPVEPGPEQAEVAEVVENDTDTSDDTGAETSKKKDDGCGGGGLSALGLLGLLAVVRKRR